MESTGRRELQIPNTSKAYGSNLDGLLFTFELGSCKDILLQSTCSGYHIWSGANYYEVFSRGVR
jgi:hypothetical protein